MNLSTATNALTAYLDADIPCFLWGAPGIGKSDTVRAVAAERNWPVIDFRAILRDPVDLRGLPAIVEGGARWLPPSDLPDEKRDGPEGLLFLDELNAAAPSVQAACFGLVLDRKVGEYHLPAGWRIVAAGNRQTDRAAAQRMPTALANRFAHIDIDPDVDTFTSWAVKVDLDPMIVAFVRFRPAMLHQMQGSDLRAFPTPRAWAQVAKVINTPSPLRFGLLTGLVGEGAAAEMEGFIRIYKNLPSLDLVLANPNGAPVPEEPAARFAIASGLARKVTDKTIANGMTYMGRLPREFEIMFAVDASKRDPSLSHTSAFVDWTMRNQDVIFN